MKKTFLAMILIGSSTCLFAQDTQNNTTTKTSVTSYNAYSNVPPSVHSNFMRDYPTVTDVTWQQADDNTYKASYKNMGRNIKVYYTTNGSSYSVALPVVQNYVPEEIITNVLDKYGDNVYSVSSVKTANGGEAYHVTVIENGQTRHEYLGVDGNMIDAMNMYRVNDAGTVNMKTNDANTTNNNSTMVPKKDWE